MCKERIRKNCNGKKLARQKMPTLPRQLDRGRETGMWHPPRLMDTLAEKFRPQYNETFRPQYNETIKSL